MKNKLTFLTYMLAYLFLLSKCTGQGLHATGYGIHVSNSTTLFVNGDISTSGNSTFSLTGELNFNGDLLHQGVAGAFTGNGRVTLSGNTQQIAGSSSIDFPSLRITGSGDKILQRSVSVGGSTGNGTLDLQNGTLDLNNHSLYLLNSQSTAVIYTNGSIKAERPDFTADVYWYINTANGLHTLPFSNSNGNIVPMSIERITGDLDTVRFSTYATTPDNLPLPNAPETVTHIRNTSGINNSGNTVDRYWLVQWNDLSARANLTYSYAGSESPANGNNSPKAQRWNSLNDGWESPLIGQFNPAAFSVGIPNVAFPGIWAVARDGQPLPITLLDFSARANRRKHVDLSWITINEKDNDFFTVERSKNGVTFEPVLTTDGAGTSSTPLHYALTDEQPYKGRSYYRLRQTDFDGSSTVTEPQSVWIEGDQLQTSLFPNPASHYFVIQFNQQQDADDLPMIELFNMNGQLALSRLLSESGDQITGQFRIDVGHLAKGTYNYRILLGDELLTSGKVLIQ